MSRPSSSTCTGRISRPSSIWIFRQAGLRRVSPLGETLKTLDLELVSPLTGERYGVQIKSRADLQEFERYKSEFEHMSDFTRFYFVVHTPGLGLDTVAAKGRFEIMLPKQLARLTTQAGLIDWVLDKAG